jgi:hypothetical protein
LGFEDFEDFPWGRTDVEAERDAVSEGDAGGFLFDAVAGLLGKGESGAAESLGRLHKSDGLQQRPFLFGSVPRREHLPFQATLKVIS